MKNILGACFLLCSAVLAQSNGNVENGKRLFVKTGCYECHGFEAQGGVGPRLAPKPFAVAALTAYIRRPAGQMPPYTVKIMSDAEVADIRAFLVTIPEPPGVNRIALLNQ
jgi:mono/diheme cytochrome c family protein